MILVTGATGLIGRHLVARLLAEGHPVRILVPDYKQEMPTWEGEAQPEIVTGDVLDEEALFRAATGVHVIFHLENAQWWGRLRDLERIELVGTRNLVTAARAARVGRIITLSHLGAAPSSAYSLHRIKGMVEEVIQNSGMAYTIIRSALIFGEDDVFINHIGLTLRANPFFFLMPGKGEVVLQPIHIDDVISVLVNSLESLDVVDRSVEVGGPEYITLLDLIRTVMRVTHLRRFVIPVPPYVLRWLTTIYQFIFPRSLITSQWLDILATNRSTQLGNTYTYFGVRPRRLEDTLVTYLPEKVHWRDLLRSSMRRRPKGI